MGKLPEGSLELVRSCFPPKSPLAIGELAAGRMDALFGVFSGRAHFLRMTGAWGLGRGRRWSKPGRCRPTRSETVVDSAKIGKSRVGAKPRRTGASTWDLKLPWKVPERTTKEFSHLTLRRGRGGCGCIWRKTHPHETLEIRLSWPGLSLCEVQKNLSEGWLRRYR